MTDYTLFLPFWFWWIVAAMVGFLSGAVFWSHPSHRARRQLIEHCVLINKGSDYHDVECPSGTWRYYGDTLHVRLHT